MAKSITDVSANNTFQVWLDKTNEIVDLINNEIVTASPSGDTTIGNATIVGTVTANTVVASDLFRADTISPKISSTSILSTAPFNITTNQTVLERLTSAVGPRMAFTDGTVEWQAGFENIVNRNFVITSGGATVFRVTTAGNVEISGSLTAGSISANANTATQLATARTIAATGDVVWSVSFNGSANVSAAATIPTNSISNTKIRQSVGLSVIGRSGSTTGDVADIAAASDHQVMRRSGTSIGFGALALNQSAAVTGQLSVANGGTGVATLTANKLVVGNGTSGVITPADIHWDNTNGRLGIAITTPTERLEVNGNVKAAFFIGTATSAQYADLAEKYLPDAEYEVGTVVMVGGEKEITSTQESDDFAIGVISQNPAFMMNRDLEGGVYVALKGRVPVKVIDSVQKGDILIPGPNGGALKGAKTSTNRFAIALGNSENGYVEAVIL
jgi:hypothetical protein